MNGPQYQPTPNAESLARLQQQLAQTWKPVKAAPAVWQTAALLVVLVAIVTIGIPQNIGTAGFHALKPGQMGIYYGVIAAAVLALAPAVVRRFRPGALIRVNAGLLATAIFAGMAITVFVLFPSLDTSHFAGGILCLERGTISGAIASLLFAIVLRRGFAPNPLRAAAATGFFSGLCGVFVLAVNCPNLTTPHILAWHLTVLLVTGATGAAVGWALARVR